MTDTAQPDISDDDRAFTVDEIIAVQEADMIEPTEPEPAWQPTEIIDGSFEAIIAAEDACREEVDNLVLQRLGLNATIKKRRRQLAQLERMARVAREPDPVEEAATLLDDPGEELTPIDTGV